MNSPLFLLWTLNTQSLLHPRRQLILHSGDTFFFLFASSPSPFFLLLTLIPLFDDPSNSHVLCNTMALFPLSFVILSAGLAPSIEPTNIVQHRKMT